MSKEAKRKFASKAEERRFKKAKEKGLAPKGEKKKGEDFPPEKPKDGFTSNPMTKFRGNRTAMKRPSGRKR